MEENNKRIAAFHMKEETIERKKEHTEGILTTRAQFAAGNITKEECRLESRALDEQYMIYIVSGLCRNK